MKERKNNTAPNKEPAPFVHFKEPALRAVLFATDRSLESRVWFSGQVKLGVVDITVKLNIIFTENVSKWEEVNNEKEGPKDRPLGHPSRQTKRLRGEGF